MHSTLMPERLKQVEAMDLSPGSHDTIEDGMSVMEAVSYVAGEPWSNKPACASPVIAMFMRKWNDALGDEALNRLLKPLIPVLVGTASTKDVEDRRSYLAVRWLIHVHTRTWMNLALHKPLHRSPHTGHDPVLSVAYEAILLSGGIAAMHAANSGAAVKGNGEASRDAAEDAARMVVSDLLKADIEPWNALKPTIEFLQAGAVDLVHRMINEK